MKISTTGLLCVLIALGSLIAACQTDPLTGETTLNLYSYEDEKRLGDEAAQPIIAQLGGLYPDQATQDYVDRVGQKVMQAGRTRLKDEADFPDWDFKFYVVNDSMINAFALPGGHVFVTRGIMQQLESEAELAGLLGHEVTHVFARHSVERMSETTLMILPVALLGSVEETAGVGAVGILAVQLLTLSYGRDDEHESDAFGMRFAARAGYDPAGIIGVMEMLNEVTAAHGGGPPEFLSTHPDPGNRVEDLTRQLNNEYDGGGSDKYVQNVAEYNNALVDMRAAQPAYDLADQGDAVMAEGFDAYEGGNFELEKQKYLEALKLYQQAVAKTADHAILHVNVAQAQYYLEDYDAAEQAINRALSLESGTFWPNFMGGMVAIQREENSKAQTRFLRALDLVPGSPVGSYYLAVAYDRENDTQPAIDWYQNTWDALNGQGELAERSQQRLIELGAPDPAG